MKWSIIILAIIIVCVSYWFFRRNFTFESMLSSRTHATKVIYLLPRYAGNAEQHWYLWLQKALEQADSSVAVNIIVPPNWQRPGIKETLAFLEQTVPPSAIQTNTYFIGHSVGCQAWMRYITHLKQQHGDLHIGGMVLVAAWVSIDEPWKEIEEWCRDSIDFLTLRSVLQKDNTRILISDNDPYTSNFAANQQMFSEKLDIQPKLIHGKKHFTDNVMPEVLEAVRRMLKKE